MFLSQCTFIKVGFAVLIFALATGAISARAQEEGADPRPREGALSIEEVIVTARRREESLQDIPASITAIGPNFMQEQNITAVQEISEFVPNLEMRETSRASNSEIRIRGIGGGSADPTFPTGVGMYLNGLFIPNTVGAFFSLLDVERVEVLRGPQGTLFGKNTTGGAVNIVTRRPSPEVEGELMARVGSNGRQDALAIFNAPLSDELYMRAAIGVLHRDGNLDNELNGETLNGQNIVSTNVALRWVPTERLTADISAIYMNQQQPNRGGNCDFREVTRIQTVFHEDQGGGNFQAACEAEEALGPRATFSDKNQFLDVQQFSFFPELEWDLTDVTGLVDDLGVQLKAGYRKVTYEFLIDRDFTAENLDSVMTLGTDAQNAESTTFEALIEGSRGSFDFLLGYNFFQDDSRVGDERCWNMFNRRSAGSTVECTAAKAVFFEIAPHNSLGFGPAPFATNIFSETSSHGVFFHGSYQFSDWITADFGGRWTEEERKFRNIEWNPQPSIFVGDPVHLLNDDTVALFGQGSDTWTKFTPMASLNLSLPSTDLASESLLYFLWSEGFQSGGFNTELNVSGQPQLTPLLSFDPETMTNYEVGLKMTMLDGRARFNLAVFQMDYEDKQEEITIENLGGQFGADPTLGIRSNAAEAKIEGVELEFVVRPLEALQIDGAFGYLDPRFSTFRTFDPESGEIVNVADRRFASDVPERTFSGNVSYTFYPAGGDSGSVTARVGAYFQSETELETGLTEGTPPTGCFEDSYWKYNARLTWRSPRDQFETALFGNNLSDEDIFAFCDINTARGLRGFLFEPEATWGLEATYRF